MDLITKITELEANLKRLADYRYSSNAEERDFYRKLIKFGICFVVLKNNEKLLWGPSRFVGYRDNSMTLHKGNAEKDGRDTNPTITAILNNRHPEQDAHFEELYSDHCKDLGFTASPDGPFRHKRKYWSMLSSQKLLKRRP
jgi:hypothetical protein